MMNPQSSPVEMDQVQVRRIQMARVIIQASIIATSVLSVIFAILWVTAPQFAGRYVAGVLLVFVVFSGISLWLIRRQRLGEAITVYLVAVVVGLTVSIYLLGGITGPLTVAFVMTVVIAGLIGGIKVLRNVSIAVGIIYLTLALLEATQVLHPPRVPDVAAWLIESVLFLAVFTVTALVAGVFIGQTERAFVAERQRGLELVEASRQAEQSATAERELREREAHSAAHLRETVAGYVDYLSRVAAGDYTARVDVGVLDEDVEGDRELHALGEYLNTTVDALVAALTQARETQRRYTEQTWQTVVASGRAQPGFAYRQNQITPEAEWLPQMTRAVDSATLVAEGEGAAVPLVINRQVVGALGGQHPDGRPWTDEELSLIENVTGQLAQTIESLRLFDETQRRATDEQMLSRITANLTRSLDMSAILQTVVRELGEMLPVDEVSVLMGVQNPSTAQKDEERA
jgi:GAF domain-containing protein